MTNTTTRTGTAALWNGDHPRLRRWLRFAADLRGGRLTDVDVRFLMAFSTPEPPPKFQLPPCIDGDGDTPPSEEERLGMWLAIVRARDFWDETAGQNAFRLANAIETARRFPDCEAAHQIVEHARSMQTWIEERRQPVARLLAKFDDSEPITD